MRARDGWVEEKWAEKRDQEQRENGGRESPSCVSGSHDKQREHNIELLVACRLAMSEGRQKQNIVACRVSERGFDKSFTAV